MSFQLLYNRLRPGILLFFLFEFFSLLTRTFLLVISWSQAEISFFPLFKIYATGLVYDSAFFFYLFLPYFIYMTVISDRFFLSKFNRIFHHALFAGFTMFSCFLVVAEYFFWEEFQVRFNFIAVDYLIYTKEVISNIRQSYPMPVIFGWIFVFGVSAFFLFRKFVDASFSHSQRSTTWKTRLPILAGPVILPVFFYLLLGQDFRNISQNTFQRELASSGPYQFVAAFRNNELDYRQFYLSMTDKEVDQIVRRTMKLPEGAPYDYFRDFQGKGEKKRLNVVLIMVESLSYDFLTRFNPQLNLTPNLESLTTQSLFFSNLYATGTRTTRGLEAVELSLPPTPGRSIVKRIGRESGMVSLATIFKQHGYQTSFIYGGRGYFDNMNAFFLGNDTMEAIDQHSTPKEEIGFQNAWGMADEYLFAQVLKAGDRDYAKKKPFFYHVLTTSNHRPYTYPDGRVNIPSGSGREGAVKYTDWAIGNFLKEAKKKPWFEDTIFLIVADHQASSAGKTDLPIARYHIPLWIYSPKHVKPAESDILASQIDIPVTLLSMLNFNYRAAFFGKDLLSISKEDGRALIGTYQSLGLYRGDQLAVLRPVRQAFLHNQEGKEGLQVQSSSLDDSLIKEAVALYQAGCEVYNLGMNRVERQGLKLEK